MRSFFAGAMAAGLAAFAPQAGHADVLMTLHIHGYCLDVNQSNKQVILWNCHGGVNQAFITSYGQMRLGNECLDTQSGGRAGQSKQGEPLVVAACSSSKSQRWGLVENRLFRNEEGWCADIKGGSQQRGTPIIAWQCGSQSNQKWQLGSVVPISQAAAQKLINPAQQKSAVTADGKINSAGGIVAAGGGNLIGQDGASLIGKGGAGIVAAGGGNIVAAGGGNIIMGR